MKKSGFTLIELLAVIAILAIILVISIPKILDVIETSKINTLKNAVKLIADSAEKKYTENEAFLEEEEITCDSVSKINDEDYASCTISFDENGIAKVSITGKGKFDGLKITNGTKENAEVKEITKPTYGMKAVEYITNLLEYDGEGLKKDNTSDQNIRYYGSNPNNYVSFNNELWRIIGVFKDNVKLVRKDVLSNSSWDSSDSSINKGSGVNQWGESTDGEGNEYLGAKLQIYLNKMYYGGDTTVICYRGRNNTTKVCQKDSKGNFLTIDETSKSLIDNHIWNTGAVEYNTRTDTLAFYNAERGTIGKTCTSGDYCNDTIVRTTEWTGYVALPYVTDWAYASENSICETNMQTKDSSNNYICKNNNWMHNTGNDSFTWYLSPAILSNHAIYVWGLDKTSGISTKLETVHFAFFPTIYLKNNVQVINGNGTSDNPYKLKLGE